MIGILNCGGTGLLHAGQKEDGKTIEIFLGRRYIQTFRKLPITAPKKKTKMIVTTSIMLKSIRELFERSTYLYKTTETFFCFSMPNIFNTYLNSTKNKNYTNNFLVPFVTNMYRFYKPKKLCEKNIIEIKHFYIDKNKTFF